MTTMDILNLITICMIAVAIFFCGVSAGAVWAGDSPTDPKSKADEKAKEDGK